MWCSARACGSVPARIVHSFSYLERSTVAERAEIGPFARLRPGSTSAKVRRSAISSRPRTRGSGPGAKASHLSYLGDTSIGAAANIGAGTITCNYDGFGKYQTQIGAGAFIGSNTALVAPVSVGDGAIVAAGSTITDDVPADGFAVARARQETRSGACEAAPRAAAPAQERLSTLNSNVSASLQKETKRMRRILTAFGVLEQYAN